MYACAECRPYLSGPDPNLPRCKLDDPALYLQGTWQRRPAQCRVRTQAELKQFAYKFSPRCYGPEFDCRDEAYSCFRRTKWIAHWDWTPDFCNFDSFDPHSFDRLLANRTLLVVGDSLAHQQYQSLWELFNKEQLIVSGKFPAARLWSGGTMRISHDHLMVAEGEKTVTKQSLSVNPQSQWATLAREADIIVFNTGHHYWTQDPSFEYYSEMVRSIFRFMRDYLKTQLLLFRSSNMGHEFPENFERPIEHPYVLSTPGEWATHWYQLRQAEHIWSELASEYEIQDRFQVLNISFTDGRADAHENFRPHLDKTKGKHHHDGGDQGDYDDGDGGRQGRKGRPIQVSSMGMRVEGNSLSDIESFLSARYGRRKLGRPLTSDQRVRLGLWYTVVTSIVLAPSDDAPAAISGASGKLADAERGDKVLGGARRDLEFGGDRLAGDHG